MTEPRHSPLAAALPWHREARALRSLWRRRPLAGRSSAWGTLALFAVSFACGMVGFLRVHVDGTPDENVATAFYNTISLYTLSFNGPGGVNADLALWIAAFAAPLTTARVLFQLVHDKISRFAERYVLRQHVIVCGAGFRGAFLASQLAQAGEIVVLIDNNEQAPGLVEARRNNVWPLVGDATSPEVLRRAGAERASRVVAFTSDDYVNASIAAAVARVPKGDPEVFVHVDDPSVARIVDAPLRRGGSSPIPFSTASRSAAAAIDKAADSAFDRAEAIDHRASIVIFGDEPVIDAMVLELHRRWQMAMLGGADRTLQPLVTVFAPNATARVAALRNRHGHPLDEIDLVAHDIDMDFGTSLDGETSRNLRATLPLDDVWVVDREPLSALRLALSVSRIIGSSYTVRLLSEGSIDELTQAVEAQTLDDDGVADIIPECLVELALGEATLDDGRRAARLAYSGGLARDADAPTKDAAIREAQRHLDHAGAVVDEPAPVATRWHADVHHALALPDPAVFIRAGLRVDALTARTASVAGPALIRRAFEQEQSADRDAALASAFTYYARLAASITDADSRLFETLLAGVADTTPADPHLKEDIVVVLELRRKVLRLQVELDGREGPAAARDSASRNGARRAEATDSHAPAFAMVAGGPPAWDDADGPPAEVARELVEAVGHPRWMATLINTDASSGAAALVGAVGSATGMAATAYVPAPDDDADASTAELAASGAPSPPTDAAVAAAPAIPAGYTGVHVGHRDECSIAEPLRAWADLLEAGVDTRKVPVLIYPGTPLVSSELALAAALGAPIALVDVTAPDAAKSLAELYDNATNVAPLPNDAGTLRAFLRQFDDAAPDLGPAAQAQLAHGRELLDAVREGWDDGERQPLRLLMPLLTA